MRWRRMIGVDPHPFAAIPERPKRHTRFHRIAARIRVEESKLVGHLGGVTLRRLIAKGDMNDLPLAERAINEYWDATLEKARRSGLRVLQLV